MARYRDPFGKVLALAAVALVAALAFWGVVLWAVIQVVQWLITK